MKIWIVEDDTVIATSIKETLERYDYTVTINQDFFHVMDEFQKDSYDLVLMDLVLPVENGYYYTQEIRKLSTVPVIFISSKGEEMDMVMAMQFGADDYVKKPFSMSLLVAKVNALLRRTYQFNTNLNQLRYGDCTLSLSHMTFTYQGESLELTKTECAILEALFLGKGAVVSREKIMEQCWQGDDFIDDNTLAVNMTRLRKKLAEIGLASLIQTKRGKGYYLE